MFKEYDHLIKLVIIGNSGVGKSSLMMRFSDDQYNESYLATIGVDFRFKTLDINGESIKIQIWDTAGQERFRTITNAYYKGADGIVIVYDKLVASSFEDIKSYWINEIENYGEKNVSLLLLGNKSDMDGCQVDDEKAKSYALSKNMIFYEVSAKTSGNVNQAFMDLSQEIIKKRLQNPSSEKKNKKNSIKNLTKEDSEQQQNNCC